MSPLWTSGEIEQAAIGKATAPFAVSGISIDTRSLQPGDLFVALQGDSRDGHAFVDAAFSAGASGALVSKQTGLTGPLAIVGHTQRALEDLALAARLRSAARVIAVTGSAGKTTTKEMLRLACNALGQTHASAASFNNHWGVPLTLAQLRRDCDYAVIEIGMNHFGEIRNLVRLARPHVALITTIAAAHIEFFGTLDAIADAKAEIFEGLVPGGAAILPLDSSLAPRLRERAQRCGVTRIIGFGTAEGCEGRLIAAREDPSGQEIEADILGRRIKLKLAAPGRHMASNAVGALLGIAALGGDVEAAANGLSTFSALNGRGARFTIAGLDVIDESYNANPASMAAALEVLGNSEGRRIAVLGDMLEMGPDGPAHHAALAPVIESARVDLVFAVGQQMKALWEALPPSRRGSWADNSTTLLVNLLPALRAGDVVLVKGSFGSKMSVVIEALRKMAG